MLKKILIPYDLSENSKIALRAGLAIAGQNPVSVLHVIPFNAQIAAYEILPPSPEVQAGIAALIREELKTMGVSNADIRVCWGDAVTEIINQAVEGAFDMVVMSTRGRTGLKHILLGSVAEKVFRHSPVPVFITRADVAWPSKKVVFPLDFSPESSDALKFANDFAKDAGCELHLVHVISMPDTYALWSDLPKMPAMDLEGLFEKNRGRLRESIKGHTSLASAIIDVRVGPVHDEIIQAAKEINADLILLPTHAQDGLAHFFTGSESEQVVRHAPCNILCFCPGEGTQSRQNHLKTVKKSV